MKTSIRTFSDSSNEFLPTLGKRLHPLDDFLARELCSLLSLNLNFFQYLTHRVGIMISHVSQTDSLSAIRNLD